MDILCDHGCGNLALFKTIKAGKNICSKSSNSCPVIRKRNSDALLLKNKDPGYLENRKNMRKNYSSETRKMMGWSAGITKHDDPRLERPTLVGKKFGASLNGHSVESKRKLSKARIEYLERSPHIKWYTLSNGLKVQGTWEVQVGEKLIELGYTISRERIKFDEHRCYTPDFKVSDHTYIEVKGWLSDRDKNKYRLVKKDNPNLKIFLIRNENGINNFTKFISGQIKLEDVEDLYSII